MPKLTLSILPYVLAVCRLDHDAKIPAWAILGKLFSVTKTADELSIVCDVDAVPPGVKSEKPFKAFKVEGPLDFALTGILSSLAAPLAEAKISIFALSTYDTDYILVKEDNVERATEVLEKFCTVRE